MLSGEGIADRQLEFRAVDGSHLDFSKETPASAEPEKEIKTGLHFGVSAGKAGVEDGDVNGRTSTEIYIPVPARRFEPVDELRV